MALGKGEDYIRLGRRFFARPCSDVARALLGKILVCRDRAGVIVETEAYLGPQDLASHARFGATERTRVMFGPPGFSYVYLCYGIHEMFNVVTDRAGQAAAVLVRALAPRTGLGDARVAAGPGKLTRVMAIDRSLSGVDLTESEDIYIARGHGAKLGEIAVGPRIGVDYAGTWADQPLRYYFVDHPSVSRPPPRGNSKKSPGAGPP